MGPHPSPNHEEHTDPNHEEGQELTTGETPRSRGIRLTETFAKNTHQCVDNKEDACEHSVGQPCPGSQDPEEGKKEAPLEARLHKLGGIPGSQLHGEQGMERG